MQERQTTLTVELKLLDPGMEPPAYAHPGDAGADLCSTIDCELNPLERRLIPTGISMSLPNGYVGPIHPRSGLATRHGITIVNAPGTVDAGYRGEIAVTLLNTDSENAFRIVRGDRIAQLLIQKVETAQFRLVDVLPSSVRGQGGFGSTGGFTRD